MKHKLQPFLILFVFLGFLVAWDFLFFGKWIWELPNESPWNTNHFYNFLFETQRALKTPKTKPRVLVLGSSIAYYSMDRNLLEEELRTKWKQDVEVVYLSYAGKSPMYAYLYRNKIQELQPDLVVYPINFIDFRWHRAYVLGSNHSDVSEVDLLLDAIHPGEAPQAKYFFPWETLQEAWDHLDSQKKADYLWACILNSYRLKDIWWENIENLYQHRFGRNTSYHAYMGADIPERVTTTGLTGKEFRFRPVPSQFSKGFFVEVVPALVRNKLFSLEITDESGNHTQRLEWKDSGWKKIVLDPKFQTSSQLRVVLSHTWRPYEAQGVHFDYNRDELGVRLQQTFGLEKPLKNLAYIRPHRLEDDRYLGMSDFEYRDYFHYRLLTDLDKRPGIGYLVVLEQTKKQIRTEKFRPVLHFRYLNLLMKDLEKKGIPTLLINNPENPVSLEWYAQSDWYKEHLHALQSLPGKKQFFLDWKDKLPMQNFSDFHHFTYWGTEKMNPFYAEEIGKILNLLF